MSIMKLTAQYQPATAFERGAREDMRMGEVVIG